MKAINRSGTAFFVSRYRLMLMLGGYELTPDSKVLDFGCGEGGMVYAFRDLGYDEHGFDIHNYLKLRQPDDERLFNIGAAQSDDPANFSVDWDNFRLPYNDKSFDFVFSVTVIEHIQNHEGVLSELSRITKPSGVNIHEFPPKWSLIEPHIRVPLGGAIVSPLWYRLWATLGIRNELQKGLSASEVTWLNTKYAKTGINYLSNNDLLKLGQRYFARSAFIPEIHDYCSAPHCGIRFRHSFTLARSWHSNFRAIVWWLGPEHPSF
jgi:SAM-dependent methyltransferase